MRYFITIFLLLLSGCNQDDRVKGDPDSPGYVATRYFYAIYNDKDLDKAADLAAPQLSRIMYSYGSPSQFARNLLNLQYDEVVIEEDRTNVSVRQQYDEEAKVNLVFTGYFNGEKVDDFRSVRMVRKKGKWQVSEIIADPYAR